jgi:radical SAM superfamily enzyme YgiQ (UPF0313 family)
VLDFCQEVRRRIRFPLRWACQTRVDAVHLEILQTMRDAGCVQVDFGVESGSDKVIKILSRKTSREKIVTAFRRARAVGLRTCATFIIGSPEEREEDLAESAKLAHELRADYTAFYYATPYPGTKLYELALANQWIPESTEFDDNWVHRQPNRPVMSIHFTPEELIEIRRRLANPFFARNYLHLRNVPFYLELARAALRYPKTMPRALRQVLRTRRLEDAVESLFAAYQYGKYEEGHRRTSALRARGPAVRPHVATPERLTPATETAEAPRRRRSLPVVDGSRSLP